MARYNHTGGRVGSAIVDLASGADLSRGDREPAYVWRSLAAVLYGWRDRGRVDARAFWRARHADRFGEAS